MKIEDLKIHDVVLLETYNKKYQYSNKKELVLITSVNVEMNKIDFKNAAGEDDDLVLTESDEYRHSIALGSEIEFQTAIEKQIKKLDVQWEKAKEEYNNCVIWHKTYCYQISLLGKLTRFLNYTNYISRK